MIAFLGDSIVRGISMTEAFGQPYPALWAAATGAGVQNFGLGGDASGVESAVYTGGARQRLLDLVLPHGYEEGVYIAIGANDVIQRVPAATTLANIEAMIQACQAAGVQRVVLGEVAPQNAADGAQNTLISTINAGINAFPATYPFVAVAHLHARLANPGDTTQLKASANCGDGLHLSAAGHQDALAELLEVQAFGRSAL